MINCNLLPWREWQRKKNQKTYYFHLALTLILSYTLSSAFLIPLNHHIKNQIILNQALEQEQVALQPKLRHTKGLLTQRNNLLKKEETSECIDKKNNSSLTLLIKTTNQMSNGIALQLLTYQQNSLTLTGPASNTKTLQAYLGRL